MLRTFFPVIHRGSCPFAHGCHQFQMNETGQLWNCLSRIAHSHWTISTVSFIVDTPFAMCFSIKYVFNNNCPILASTFDLLCRFCETGCGFLSVFILIFIKIKIFAFFLSLALPVMTKRWKQSYRLASRFVCTRIKTTATEVLWISFENEFQMLLKNNLCGSHLSYIFFSKWQPKRTRWICSRQQWWWWRRMKWSLLMRKQHPGCSERVSTQMNLNRLLIEITDCSVYNPCGRYGYCRDNKNDEWTCVCKFWWNGTRCDECPLNHSNLSMILIFLWCLTF